MDTLTKKTRIEDYSHFQDQILGWLTIKEMGKFPVTKWRKVKCVCKCGKTIEAPLGYILRGSIRSCGCLKNGGCQGNKHHRWNGYEGISGTFWKNLKRGATVRNIPFLLTREEIWELYLEQNKKCALSGVDIKFAQSHRVEHIQEANASIDRKDSTRPYVIDNIQWVDKTINMMKQSLTNEEFIRRCKLVYQSNKDAD